MGIHASDNLSHLAHQENEPFVPDHYDYDEYVIVENYKIIGNYGHNWNAARTDFLTMFNVQKRKVKLMGRVFN